MKELSRHGVFFAGMFTVTVITAHPDDGVQLPERSPQVEVQASPRLATLTHSVSFSNRTETYLRPAVVLGGTFLLPIGGSISIGPHLAAVLSPLEPNYVLAVGSMHGIWSPLRDVQSWSPRVTAELGLAVRFADAPQDFAVEHDLPPAFGPLISLGLGFERRMRTGGWFLEGAFSFAEHRHGHDMTDARTGERSHQTEVWRTMFVGPQFGMMFSL
ncbi:MAG TPA: hypothetical protein VHO25_10070 [Polyangiaceae bacterium]|nr:hypothetical protein [Polyangiaceae bacterium]